MNKQLIAQVKSAFKERFGKQSLLIASPGRVNLIGEHTDYNHGLVLPAAIDKYIVCGLSANDQNHTRVVAMDTNETMVVDLTSLQKQEPSSWKNYILGVLWGLLERGLKLGNFNLVFSGNIPIGAGMSSSAALENGVVFGLNKLFDLCLTKEDMIDISVAAEHQFAGVKCGIMDQFSNLYGKEGHAIFLSCSDLSYELVPLDLEEYQLLLLNTSIKHQLSDSPYNERKMQCNSGLKSLQKRFPALNSLSEANLEQLNALKGRISEVVYNRCLYIIEENERVKAAKSAILSKDWKALGALLFASHAGLQDLYDVSCAALDLLVDLARKHEAVAGSRMMGRGFGGCTINLVKKEGLKDFIKTAEKSYRMTFGRATNAYPIQITNGTHVIAV